MITSLLYGGRLFQPDKYLSRMTKRSQWLNSYLGNPSGVSRQWVATEAVVTFNKLARIWEKQAVQFANEKLVDSFLDSMGCNLGLFYNNFDRDIYTKLDWYPLCSDDSSSSDLDDETDAIETSESEYDDNETTETEFYDSESEQ